MQKPRKTQLLVALLSPSNISQDSVDIDPVRNCNKSQATRARDSLAHQGASSNLKPPSSAVTAMLSDIFFSVAAVHGTCRSPPQQPAEQLDQVEAPLPILNRVPLF